MGLKYSKHPVDDNGWTDWISVARLQKIACCDCGLVHQFQFKKVGKIIYFKAKRDVRATAARRRTKRGH